MKKKTETTPTEGITRCDCGCKYWDKNTEGQWRCHSCDWQYHPRMEQN